MDQKDKFNESEVRATYRGLEHALQDLCAEAKYILQKRIGETGIKIHGIEARVKEVDSLLAKARTIECHDPCSDINDAAGLRVISLFRDDLEKIGRLIEVNFDVVACDDKIERGDALGYQSVHYICRLPKSLRGARYEHLLEKPFEIQVRTICMHCWATVSHYIDYKADWDVPKDLKKALSALSGLFYVADTEFQQFNAARLESKRNAETPTTSRKPIEINLDTVSALFRAKMPSREEPADDEYAGSHWSAFVHEIKAAGYSDLAEVGKDFDLGLSSFNDLEREENNIGWYNRVGVGRGALSFASPEFRKVKEPISNAAFLRILKSGQSRSRDMGDNA